MPNFDNVDRFDHPTKATPMEDVPMEAIDPLREMYAGFNIIQQTIEQSGQILTRDLESARDYKNHLLKELEITNIRISTLDGRLNALRNAHEEVIQASQVFTKSVEESDMMVNPIIKHRDPEESTRGLSHRNFEAQPYAYASALDSDGGIHFGRNAPESS